MPVLSIRSRLIFLFTLQVIIIFFAGGFYLDWRLRRTLENELSDKLQSMAYLAASQIEGELLLNLAPGDEDSRTYNNLKTQLNSIKKQTGVRRIYLLSNSSASLVDTREDISIGDRYAFLPVSPAEIENVFSGGTVISTLFRGADNRMYKTGFTPVYHDAEEVAALAIEASARTLESIQIVRRDLLLLGFAILIGSILFGFLFSRQITNPINRLKSAAQKIARGDYESAIKVSSKDEIGFLGQTMEEMRRAIIQRDTRQKAMLAGVAHEIRNPLGGIELFAGLLASEVTDEKAKTEAQKIQKEVQNLKKIVNDFLNYARPNKPRKEVCTVQDVWEDVRMLMTQELEEVTVRFTGTEQPVLIDRQHLKQIFFNLMKNSVEAMEGKGTIVIQTEARGDRIVVIFSDSGPGIPDENREQIFEPFFTGRTDGTGLGLAIVKSLVEENGGEIKLQETRKAAFEIIFIST